jgi:hypothetical protein
MRTIIGVALLVALTVTGCGLDKGTGAPDSTPTPTATPPPTAQPYQTVEALKDAAVAAGMTCANWVQDNVVKEAAESGHCSDEDVFTTYTTDADLQAAVENARGMSEMLRENKIEPSPNLVGVNWIINAPGADKLAPKLGGTVQR